MSNGAGSEPLERVAARLELGGQSAEAAGCRDDAARLCVSGARDLAAAQARARQRNRRLRAQRTTACACASAAIAAVRAAAAARSCADAAMESAQLLARAVEERERKRVADALAMQEKLLERRRKQSARDAQRRAKHEA